MGGDPEVKKFLSGVIAVEAFKHAGTPEWDQLFTTRPYIVILDYLIYFKGLPVERMWTLEALFRHFWKRIAKHLFDPTYKLTMFVVTCDDRSNVAQAKGDTQAARVDAAVKSYKKRGLDEEVQPYPLGTVFVPQGVRLPDGDEQPICLRRLALSRCYNGTRSNLGNELWQAFHSYIFVEMDRLKGGPLEHRTLMFDHDKKGPWYFHPGKPAIQLLHRAHDLGEADPANIWWANISQDNKLPDGSCVDVHIDSSDGDHMPLSMLYMEYRDTLLTSKLWWHCTSDEVAVDMNKVAEQVLTRFQSPEHFALAFYLSGCDYTVKKYYANFFNCRAIMDAVARVDLREIKSSVAATIKAAAAAASASTESEDRFAWVPAFFRRFLLELYFPKLSTVKVAAVPGVRPKTAADYTVDVMREMCARKKSKTLRFPSVLETAYQEQNLQWLVTYGATAKDGKKPKDPAPPCAALLEERRRWEKPPKSPEAAAAASSSSSVPAADGNWRASSVPDVDQLLSRQPSSKKSKYFMMQVPPTSPADQFSLPPPAARSLDAFLLPSSSSGAYAAPRVESRFFQPPASPSTSSFHRMHEMRKTLPPSQ
jgi:hypothetical protein